MFVSIPDKETKTGSTYEISREKWTVISVSKKGVRRVLKPNKSGQVWIAGEYMMIYDIAKLAGLGPKSWPYDDRRWYEHEITSDIFGFRYRQFYDGQVQKMNRHGDVSYPKWTLDDGYYTVKIAGKDVKVHQLMGLTPFVPKPDNMPLNWTIHHINNNTANNHAWNLEWASPKKQTKERRPMEQSSIQSCPVIGTALHDVMLKDGTMIRKGEDTQTFDNAAKAAEAIIDGHQSAISLCIYDKRNFHAYFMWRTPLNDEDFDNEVFKFVATNNNYERLVSTYGRLKYVFKNGYAKIITSEDKLTKRSIQERDRYPVIKIDGFDKSVHRLVVEIFFGSLDETITIDGRIHNLVVDHIDDNKHNAQLGNLQILTVQENNKKRHLKLYTTSVASAINGKYECSHKTRNNAIDYVQKRGHPEASLEELNAAIHLTAHMNIPAKLYGRTWIRAHFE